MPGIVLLIAGGVRFRPLTAGGCVAALMLGFTLPVLKTEVFNDQSKPAWREATRDAGAVARPDRRPGRGEPHMYYQTVDYYLPEGVPVLSLQTYLERLAAGTLDRARLLAVSRQTGRQWRSLPAGDPALVAVGPGPRVRPADGRQARPGGDGGAPGPPHPEVGA